MATDLVASIPLNLQILTIVATRNWHETGTAAIAQTSGHSITCTARDGTLYFGMLCYFRYHHHVRTLLVRAKMQRQLYSRPHMRLSRTAQQGCLQQHLKLGIDQGHAFRPDALFSRAQQYTMAQRSRVYIHQRAVLAGRSMTAPRAIVSQIWRCVGLSLGWFCAHLGCARAEGKGWF